MESIPNVYYFNIYEETARDYWKTWRLRRDLVPWDDLSQEEQEKDRQQITVDIQALKNG